MPIINQAQQPVIDPALATGISLATTRYQTIDKFLEEARRRAFAGQTLLSQLWGSLLDKALSGGLRPEAAAAVIAAWPRYEWEPATGHMITPYTTDDETRAIAQRILDMAKIQSQNQNQQGGQR